VTLIYSLFTNFVLLFFFYKTGKLILKFFFVKDNTYQNILFGFSIFTIFAYFLFFVLYLSSSNILIISALLTLLYVIISIYKFRINFSKLFLIDIIKFIIPITFLYLLPSLLYGEQFHIFRGNIWDSFNYASLASLFNNYNYLEIINKDFPDYYLQHQNIELIAKYRPLTSLLVSFFLKNNFLDIFFSIYLFKIFSTILTAISLNYFLNKFDFCKRKNNFLISLTYVFSFWFIYIYEIDAFSHLISLPIFIFCIAELKNLKKEILLKNYKYSFYFAIINASLFFLYPEIFLINLVIYSIFFICDFFYLPNNSKKNYLLGSIFILLIFLVTIIFSYETNYQFLKIQIHQALGNKIDWWGYYGSFILGWDNLVLDNEFVINLKNIISSQNIFKTLKFIINSHFLFNYDYFYFNIIPSLSGLYYLSIGEFKNHYQYFHLFFLFILNFYLIKKIYTNVYNLYLTRNKKLLFIFIFFISLSLVLIYRGSFWTLIKIYFYISPFIFLLFILKIKIITNKINFKINYVIILLLISFPLYKYSSNNYGIGRIDSFPSIIDSKTKINFDWYLNISDLKRCKNVMIDLDDYHQRIFTILKLNHNNINFDLKNINKKDISVDNTCSITTQNSRFIIN
jgi:hypothetical protein